MTNLRRRLKKLEALITDQRGLVPLSPAWLDYWHTTTDRMLSGEDREPTERIPMAYVDLILAEADQRTDLQAAARPPLVSR
jgi:hypothetical protein